MSPATDRDNTTLRGIHLGITTIAIGLKILTFKILQVVFGKQPTAPGLIIINNDGWGCTATAALGQL